MKKQKYLLNVLLILALTLVVLWYTLKDNYKEVIGAIRQMNPASLLLVLLWGALFTVVWGMAYVILGRKYVPGYKIRSGIAVAFIGAFFSGITPSSTGGQFGQVYVMKKQGIAIKDSVSLLWADFIVYQTTMMVYVTILFLLKYAYYSAQSAWFNIILLGYLINLLVILALYTVALFPKAYIKFTNWLAKFLSRFKFIKDPEKTVQSWTLQMTQFTSEVKQLSKDKKRIAFCTLVNIVRLTLLYTLPYVIAVSLHIPIRPDQIVDVMALSSFVLIANSFIPIPGASGGTEIVFSLLFGGLMGKLTGAVMVLWRFSTFHVVLLIGAIIFAFVKNKYDRKKDLPQMEEESS